MRVRLHQMPFPACCAPHSTLPPLPRSRLGEDADQVAYSRILLAHGIDTVFELTIPTADLVTETKKIETSQGIYSQSRHDDGFRDRSIDEGLKTPRWSS